MRAIFFVVVFSVVCSIGFSDDTKVEQPDQGEKKTKERYGEIVTKQSLELINRKDYSLLSWIILTRKTPFMAYSLSVLKDYYKDKKITKEDLDSLIDAGKKWLSPAAAKNWENNIRVLVLNEGK